MEPILYYERTSLSGNEVSNYGSKYKNKKGDTGTPETSKGTYCAK